VERPFSVWDRIAAAYGPGESAREPTAEVFARRREARTRLYDAAAAGEVTSSDADADYCRRLRRWVDRSRRLWCDEDLQRLINLGQGPSMGSSMGAGVILWIPVLAALTSLRRGMRLGTMARIDRGMSTRRCPDCRYDLSSMRDGLGREPAATIWIGPATCPECGVSWPLVPPAELSDESTR
jgi:hypothetical protein